MWIISKSLRASLSYWLFSKFTNRLYKARSNIYEETLTDVLLILSSMLRVGKLVGHNKHMERYSGSDFHIEPQERAGKVLINCQAKKVELVNNNGDPRVGFGKETDFKHLHLKSLCLPNHLWEEFLFCLHYFYPLGWDLNRQIVIQ